MTEQISNKSKNFLLSLTKDFSEEDDYEGITITFREDKKIKLITLDLLLKKIVKENFIEKNPIQIYAFCQQCYCFLDKDIMFNKIFNCYNFYKNKKIPLVQIGNLINFLNILIIEMYEYYTKINLDDPILSKIKIFYNTVICELIELINNEVEAKKEDNEDDDGVFKIDDYKNKLEEYNEEEETNEGQNDIFKDRNSEFIEDNKDINRERFGTMISKKEEGRFSSYINEKEENNGKDMISRNTINISSKKLEKEDKKNKKDKKKEKKDEKGEGKRRKV